MSADADGMETPESLETYLHLAHAELSDIDRELVKAKANKLYEHSELLRMLKETTEAQIATMRLKLKLAALLRRTEKGDVPVSEA